jgi:hypothetical protein
MPNYTIHIHQGSHTNSQPVSLPDVGAARREAIAMFAELARDIAGDLLIDWRIEVIEPAGRTVFRLGILAEDAPLAVFSLDGRKRRPRTTTHGRKRRPSTTPHGRKRRQSTTPNGAQL